MASGSIGTGWTSLQNPVSINCTMGANEYPSGTITFNGISPGSAWWYNGGNNQTMTVYLCDSAGNNSYKLFDVTWNSEMTNTTTKTATGLSCKNLKGKALYIKATFTSQSAQYAYHRGNATDSISIGTALDQVSCTVTTADSNKGTVSGGGNHSPGTAVNISATAKSGYKFNGWEVTSGSGSFGNASSASTTFTSSVNSTVRAKWTEASYTITVNGTANTWTYGSVHSISAPGKTGHTFSKWTATAGTLANANASTTNYTVAASNATVTSTYTVNNYTITVNGSANTWAYGSVHSISAPGKTGYTFTSWSATAGSLANANASTTNYTVAASNATVTANYSINSYAITVNDTANSWQYASVHEITAPAKTGYTFSKWTATAGALENEDASTTNYTVAASDATVTSTYTINSYAISITKNPDAGGTVSSGGTWEYNSGHTITATPADGYAFSKWELTAGSGTIRDANSASTTFTVGAGTGTVRAIFVKINYTVTVVSEPIGGGVVSASPATATIGDTVVLTQTPNEGYAFDEWTSSPAVTISSGQFTMPASSVTLVAHYHLVVSTASLSSSTLTGGSSVTLTITSASTKFTHKYRVNFGPDMDTGWVSVAAGVTSVSVYVPFAWAIAGGVQKTGGTLTLETYTGSTKVGEDTITGLTFEALGDTAISLSVWRTDFYGNAMRNGTYAKYEITKPSAITSYKLIFNSTEVSSPAMTGDVLPSAKVRLNMNSQNITLRLVYGSETLDVVRCIPGYRRIFKKIEE